MSELPSGTVTFLFSDVEGSTALATQAARSVHDVLEDHRRLLRTAFAEHDGHEVGTEGDSFFVAFTTPGRALAAAASAQRALARTTGPRVPSVRVRMGIHTGQVSVSDGHYIGLAVHRAARICGAGEGGQVLVSQATRTLLHDDDPEAEGLALNDLGERTLKDFDRPIHIFELLADATAPRPEPCIRVLIADDQALVRTGFRMILEAEKDIEVVGRRGGRARQAIAEARRTQPDVVLMDVRMPELDGIEATRRLLAGRVGHHEGGHAHDLRHGRVRLRGAARRRERLSAEGRPARAAGRRDPRRRLGRRAARAVGDEACRRGVRRAGRRQSARPPPPELEELTDARARGPEADRPWPLERGDRRRSSSSATRP